ncbi:hypothetical protein [Streptomyces radicis]|uniref:hypothetical protein n=1 Tax=Streptomyces radicis TaxID=1750517 RepID=UPI0016004FA4|nr:hypothetical protein [Streptomyces radicis]
MNDDRPTDDLATVLDVEAGLREALLPSRHEAAVDGLHTVLDIEAGLAAIVRPKERRAANPAPGDGSSPDDTAFSSLSPARRMRLRSRRDIFSAYRALVRVQTCLHELFLASAGREKRRAIEAAAVIVELLAVDGRAALADADRRLRQLGHRAIADHLQVITRGRDAHDIPAGLPDGLEPAAWLVLGIGRGLGRYRGFHEDAQVERALGRARSFGALGEEVVNAIAGYAPVAMAEVSQRVETLYVADLREAVTATTGAPLPGLRSGELLALFDDFTDADLSGADLRRVNLARVRWSEAGTRWPPAFDVSALRARSAETAPGSGVWVVGSGTATVPGYADAL